MRSIQLLDSMTRIAAVAFRADELEETVARRSGFGRDRSSHRGYVILVQLGTLEAHWDPFGWGGRTMLAAHLWLVDHLEELPDGGELDVEPLREELNAQWGAVS